MKVIPLDWHKNGDGLVPHDSQLWIVVQHWAAAQFGEGAEIDPSAWLRCWVVVEETGDPERPYEVYGATAVWNVVDVPMLHVNDPGKDRDGRKKTREARDLLVGRLRSWCQDNGLRRKTVLVYVAEPVQRRWRGFLRLIGAKSANRFEVEI